MGSLLWSDPFDGTGHSPSPRGAGILFGSDVTQRFCRDNGLACIIRSHEMKQEGFEWHHNGKCLTIFSAANYCGVCGNDGAVCDILIPGAQIPKLALADLHVKPFSATKHP